MITIIIPAYNQKDYIRQAVESAFRQSLPPSRVIVVNDGSTDTTADELRSLASEHPDLLLVPQENLGVVAACEKAFELVETPYFLRLDADDYLPENYLEVLYTCLEKHPEAAFVYCDAQYFGSRDGMMKAKPWSVPALITENYIHVSALIRTSVVKKRGYFDKNMTHGFEDWDFYLKMAESGEKGVYCEGTFLWYRQKPEGGRNDMQELNERNMRVQIMKNHAPLFLHPTNAAYRFFWRLRRKLRHWFGM